jgi:hypothetical protein
MTHGLGDGSIDRTLDGGFSCHHTVVQGCARKCLGDGLGRVCCFKPVLAVVAVRQGSKFGGTVEKDAQ